MVLDILFDLSLLDKARYSILDMFRVLANFCHFGPHRSPQSHQLIGGRCRVIHRQVFFLRILEFLIRLCPHWET